MRLHRALWARAHSDGGDRAVGAGLAHCGVYAAGRCVDGFSSGHHFEKHARATFLLKIQFARRTAG
jgi:hypothetical protein